MHGKVQCSLDLALGQQPDRRAVRPDEACCDERVAGTLWHNPGALGLPANDGTPRVGYSLIAVEDSGLRFTHHALAYDHASAAKKVREAGLPEAYARALETGLWPDTAILPPPEKAATGTALSPAPVSWP